MQIAEGHVHMRAARLLPTTLVLLGLVRTGNIRAQVCEAVDPVEVLRNGTSHGVGDSLLESDLVRDRVNARMIVCASKNVPLNKLRDKVGLPPDFDKRTQQLIEAKLLVRERDRVRAAFPILLGEERDKYMRAASRTAEKIEQEFGPELSSILEEVDRRGWHEWQFHFLWSELFDSQRMWVDLINEGFAPPIAPVRYWAVYPPNALTAGTNYYPQQEIGKFFLAVTWTPKGADTTDPIRQNSTALIKAAINGGKPPAGLGGTGIFDENGSLRIPILRPGDQLLEHLSQASDKYAKIVATAIPIENSKDSLRRTGS